MTRSSLFSPTTLLLAALLLLGSDIILWSDTLARSPVNWALRGSGYIALSAVLLELAAVYRARNLFDVMTLAGIYGLANGLLIHPQSALVDVPRTLVTRAMGAHALIGLAILLFFLSLGGRRGVILIAAAALMGVLWGTWARWSPTEFAGLGETPLTTMLAYAGSVLLIAALLASIRKPPHPQPLSPESNGEGRNTNPLFPSLNSGRGKGWGQSDGDPLIIRRMTRLDWTIASAALLTLLVVHLLQGDIDSLSLVVIAMLIGYCLLVLWFQRRKKGAILLDRIALGRRALPVLTLAGAALLVGGVFGYTLNRGAGAGDPLAIIAIIFTGYGLVWLPAVSLVLGARALGRQARALRL